MRGIIDRLIGQLARLITRGFHTHVEYSGIKDLRRRGPRVVVVSHFNGFMDVIVVIAALGRLPRFVGKATLHNVVIARPFLKLAGVVLVQRRIDGEGTGANQSAFTACSERLARGDCVVIFPEGTTHDREALAPIRTGAARIALGAAAAGVSDVRLVPVGVTFGDKTRLRNDVLVVAAPAIVLPAADPEDHEAVRAVTEQITVGLGSVIPGVDDPIDAWAHERAAAVAMRRDGHEPSLAQRRGVARRTIAAPGPERQAVATAIADYTLALDVADVDDAAVSGGLRAGYVSLVARGAATWLLLPVIVWMAIVNGPAILVLSAVDGFVSVPVTKGTVRVLIAAVLFPTSWIVAAVVTSDGFWPGFGLVLAQAVALPILLWLLEGDVAALRRLVLTRRARIARARLPELAERRTRVVAAVGAIVPDN